MSSQDSRYWGLLPEEFIVGKAWLIWKSIDPLTDRMRWERFLKKVE
jgi:signal peptidase I